MPPASVCPMCHNLLPENAPLGLCVACTLKVFQEDQSGTTLKQRGWGDFVGTKDVEARGRSAEDLAWFDLCETASYPAAKGSPRGRGSMERGPGRFVSAEMLMISLVQLDLMEQAEIQEFLKQFPADLDPKNPEELARGLVRSRRLTEYQAAALLQGKSKGLVIDKYLILDKLGAGGMGMVFKALHRRIKRVVALKVLPPSFAKDETAVRRFHREAEAVAKVSHPNVVAVLDADEFNGLHFFAMEYSAGKDLKRLVEDHGTLPAERAIECIVQAARGLGAAHARGIYHRDIKPSNLMLDLRGTVKVLDLGLARMDKGADLLGGVEADPELTRPGIIMGTVAFMAPEQAYNSRSADHRSDIYSLGCTLFYLLTGRPPYDGDTLMARLIAHREAPIPSLGDSQPNLPLALDATLRRMMAKAPQDRHQSVDELISDLQACHSPGSTMEDGAVWRGLVSAATVERSQDKTVEAGPDSGLETLVDLEAKTEKSRRSRPWLLRRVGFLLLAICLASLTMIVTARMRAKARVPIATGDLLKAGARSQPSGKIVIPDPPPIVPPAIAPSADPSPPSLVTKEAEQVVPEPEEPIGEIRRFSGHKDRLVESIAVATNGRHALSAGLDCTVRYWNVSTGEEIFRFVHDGPVYSVAFSPDNRLALAGGVDKVMRLWDLEAREELPPFKGFTEPIYSVAFSPDGQYALSASRDKSVRLWEVASRSEVYSLLHQGAVTAVAFSPDGQRVLTGSEDKTVRIWKLLAPDEAHDFKGQAKVLCAAFSPDGHRALSGGDDGSVVLWNLDSKRMIRRIEGPRDQVRCVSFLPDSRHALWGTKAGKLILGNVEDDREEYRFEQTAGRLGVAVLPDGRRALTSDDDGFVRLWKLPLVLE